MKNFAFILILVMVTCMFTACSNENTQPEVTLDEETPEYVRTDLRKIPGHDELVYDTETSTIYYFIIYGSGRILMTPYIINGHFCEYIDGEIIEVIPSINIENVTN